MFVPDVVGQTTKVAELLIRKTQLVYVVKNEVYSLKYEKSKIISQSPEANSVTGKSVPVEVLVSLGEPPEGMILMPEFTGKELNEFKKWADKNKVAYQVREQEYEAAKPGIVISQEPPADTVLTYNTQVVAVAAIGSGAQPQAQTQPAGEVYHYEVPQGAKDQKIQVNLIDSSGEHQIFSNTQPPGSKLDIPIIRKGKAKLRIFIDNILVEEKEL